MELSRRDFMRSTAAFTAVASVLGTSGIAFAQDADQNCLVKVDSPDRNALAKRFKAGSAAGVEYYAYNPRRYAPALKGKLPLIVFLHGEDGVGPNGTQLTANDGATFYISDEMIQKNPTYLFAPQCPGKNWTEPGHRYGLEVCYRQLCGCPPHRPGPVSTSRVCPWAVPVSGT
ncbi:MAG: hypothetical protein ACLVJH_06090 [Faecalibacterium prausnitzii]